jgi:hypothetical protein
MPIIYQKFIYRSDLRSNPEVFYVFGDNTERVGMGGQAKEMRGEPNAIGVATKWRPGMSHSDFFNDNQFHETKLIIDADFKLIVGALNLNRIVVIPADGIGTGYSQLPQRAPDTYAYILSWLDLIKIKQVCI